MKILFIVFFDPQDLGCRHLAAYMKQYGHDIRIIGLKYFHRGKLICRPNKEMIEKNCARVSCACAGISFIEQDKITESEFSILHKEIVEWNPDIIGFGTRSKNFAYLPQIVSLIKSAAPNSFLIAGGVGPTLNPEFPLHIGVDAVIRGEGEYTLLELVSALQQNQDWHSIKNIAYIENNIIKINDMRQQENNLDKFPLPFVKSQELIIIENNSKYVSNIKDLKNDKQYENKKYFLLGSRGCIADCSYCGGRSIREVYTHDGIKCRKLRRRSISSIKKEIEIAYKNMDIECIDFHDEYFIYPYHDLIDFLEWYGENIKVPFFANFSVDQFDKHPDLMDLAFQAGLYHFGFGVQSGDEHFCKSVYNRKNDNNKIIKIVSYLYEKGLSGFLYMIMGNPLEQESNIINTYKFISNLPRHDSSLKRRIHMETTKFFTPTGDVPIKKNFPYLENLNYEHSKFYYYAMLLEFALLYDINDFMDIYNNKFFRENPCLLGELYHDTVNNLYNDYITKQINRIKGREVWFYGCGSVYQQKKCIFKNIHPKGILIDIDNEYSIIDNMTAMHPDEAVKINPNIPVIIFAKKENINYIYTKILRKWSNFKDIIVCTSIDD